MAEQMIPLSILRQYSPNLRPEDLQELGPIEYDQSKVPEVSKKHAENVRRKAYLPDMTESFARGVEYAGLIASESVGISNATNGRQSDLENTFNSLKQEITDKDIISAPEIIAARGGLPQLEDRLNKTDAQLAQIMPLTDYGVEGDGTDETVAIRNAFAQIIARGQKKIHIPSTNTAYVTDRITIEDVDGLEITGDATVKLKGGVSGGNIFLFKNCKNIKVSGLTLDGSRDTVTTTIGGYMDPITLMNCENCVVEHNKIINAAGVSVNIMNNSINNVVRDNFISNGVYAGVQIHGGWRDEGTGSYIDNKVPKGNRVIHNFIVQCGEAIRVSGADETVIDHNYIVNLAKRFESAIKVYTATHPGYSLAMGVKNIVIQNNFIDTEINPSGNVGIISIIQAANEDGTGSGNDMENITVRNNHAIIKQSVPFVRLHGFTSEDFILKNITIEGNLVESLLLASEHTSQAIAVYRRVENISIKNNQFKGYYYRGFDFTPVGYLQRNIEIDNNTIDECGATAVRHLTSTNGIMEDIRITNNRFKNVVTTIGINGTGAIQLEASVKYVLIKNNYLKVTNTSMRGIFINDASAKFVDISFNKLLDVANNRIIISGGYDATKNIKVEHNEGYLTEAEGTGTITAGTLQTNISHSLTHVTDTLSQNMVQLTLTSSLGTAKTLWVSTITSAYFKVEIDSVAGQDVTFHWRMKRTI